MSIRIICINKSGGYHDDPHEAISHLGWINEQTRASGKNTRLEIVDFLEKQSGTAYTKDMFGNTAILVTRVSPHGTKYVKTVADGKETDNLLNLPECS